MSAVYSFLPAPKNREPEAGGFKFPGPADRLTINGMTGSGKTTFAMWLFAESADFDKKPWVFIDYKGEELITRALRSGVFRPLKIDASLARLDPGPYVVSPRAQNGAQPVVDFLWQVYDRTHIGLFLDEATMIPELRGEGNSGGPFQSLLSQGRSKVCPVWTLAQRPVYVNKMVYSESNFSCAFKLKGEGDLEKIKKEGVPKNSEGYDKVWNEDLKLKPNYCRWYDANQERSFLLQPSPGPDEIITILKHRIDDAREKRSI